MPAFVEVRFKGNRTACFTFEGDAPPGVGDAVVVSVARGSDLGRVSAVGDTAVRKCGVGCNGCPATEEVEPEGAVLRLATKEDRHLGDELRKAEEDVRRTVMERARSHGLQMKISDAEWQWDRKKLTVYFTADKRVDFRSLVRDLASLFRTRIELRQIGARDESKRLGGVGRCGRQYCCSSWLPELQPVSLALAKDQRLSLNPTQISGGCGRLLCCLRYEHEFYVASRKRFPKLGRSLQTRHGRERVQAVDIFRDRVVLSAEDGSTRSVTLAELKTDVAPPDPQPPPTAAADSGDAAPTTKAAPPTAPAEPAGQAEPAVDTGQPRRRRGRRRGRRGGRRQRKPGGDGKGGEQPRDD